jgi:hypothetical protein
MRLHNTNTVKNDGEGLEHIMLEQFTMQFTQSSDKHNSDQSPQLQFPDHP